MRNGQAYSAIQLWTFRNEFSTSERRCSPAWDGQSGSWTLTKNRGHTLCPSWGARLHAHILGVSKRTRGRHWLLMDADTQTGPPVHETAQHFSSEYVPNSEIPNHFARPFDDSHIVAKLLHCRDLGWLALARAKFGSERKQMGWRAPSTLRLLEMGTRFRALISAGPRRR